MPKWPNTPAVFCTTHNDDFPQNASFLASWIERFHGDRKVCTGETPLVEFKQVRNSAHSGLIVFVAVSPQWATKLCIYALGSSHSSSHPSPNTNDTSYTFLAVICTADIEDFAACLPHFAATNIWQTQSKGGPKKTQKGECAQHYTPARV